MRRSLLGSGLIALVLMALSAPALGEGGVVTLTDPRTGEPIRYRPSFVERPKVERPTHQFFDTGQKRWVTYQASQAEMQAAWDEAFRRRVVPFRAPQPPGTIIIDTSQRYLYLVLGQGEAIRYGIGVGREGFTWSGVERISRKAEWPDWRPPVEMIERQPELPDFMPGGPDNPLGARALYLGNTLYRIHGTNQAFTIGHAVSSGCIRLKNEDVMHLFERARVGDKVIVLGPNSDRAMLTAALTPR